MIASEDVWSVGKTPFDVRCKSSLLLKNDKYHMRHMRIYSYPKSFQGECTIVVEVCQGQLSGRWWQSCLLFFESVGTPRKVCLKE